MVIQNNIFPSPVTLTFVYNLKKKNMGFLVKREKFTKILRFVLFFPWYPKEGPLYSSDCKPGVLLTFSTCWSPWWTKTLVSPGSPRATSPPVDTRALVLMSKMGFLWDVVPWTPRPAQVLDWCCRQTSPTASAANPSSTAQTRTSTSPPRLRPGTLPPPVTYMEKTWL